MKKIYLLALIIFFTNIYSKLYSSVLVIDVFGKEEVKTYEIDDNNFFRIITSQSVFKTNTNIYGNSECAGTSEIYSKNAILNFICELREGKNKAYYVIKNKNTQSSKKDEVTELAINILFVGGSGRWKNLIGQKCSFVYFEYEERASHAKVKCEINDEILSLFKT